MINKLRQFFASGQRVPDDVAALKDEAARIRAGWGVETAPVDVHVPGGMVQVTVPSGMSIQQAVQTLPQNAALAQAMQQSAYNNAMSNALAQQRLQGLQASQNIAYGGSRGLFGVSSGTFSQQVTSTSGPIFATTAYGGAGGRIRPPIFDPHWLGDYHVALEDARTAREVEET